MSNLLVCSCRLSDGDMPCYCDCYCCCYNIEHSHDIISTLFHGFTYFPPQNSIHSAHQYSRVLTTHRCNMDDVQTSFPFDNGGRKEFCAICCSGRPDDVYFLPCKHHACAKCVQKLRIAAVYKVNNDVFSARSAGNLPNAFSGR